MSYTLRVCEKVGRIDLEFVIASLFEYIQLPIEVHTESQVDSYLANSIQLKKTVYRH